MRFFVIRALFVFGRLLYWLLSASDSPFFPHSFPQLRSFNASLVEVEAAYQQSLQGIEAQYQSRESYSNVLEKEMSAALK